MITGMTLRAAVSRKRIDQALAASADSPPADSMVGDALHHAHPVSLGPTQHTLYDVPTLQLAQLKSMRPLDTLGCQHDDPVAGCSTPIHEPLTRITP